MTQDPSSSAGGPDNDGGGDDLLDLGRQLCFALYSTSRSMTAAYRPFLEEMGLTYPQYIVMLELWKHPGVTMKELGNTLQLDYGTLSPLIKRLRTARMVEVSEHARDGRAVLLKPTTASRELIGKARHMIESVLAEVGSPIEEICELRDSVARFGRRLNQVTEARA